MEEISNKKRIQGIYSPDLNMIQMLILELPQSMMKQEISHWSWQAEQRIPEIEMTEK